MTKRTGGITMKAKEAESKSWGMWPYILLALVPTIVFLKVIDLDEITKQFWISEKNMDFFSYYKSIVIMLVGLMGIAVLAVGRRRATHELKAEKYDILMGIYLLMAVVSFFLSEYKGIAAWGFPDRYEGTLVLLAYGAIFFMGAAWKELPKYIKPICNLLIITSLYIGIIGIGQYFGADFFRSSAGKSFILPAAFESAKDTLSFTFGAKTIYTTLYNTNYVGSYMVMVFMLALGFFFQSESAKGKVFYGLSAAVFFFNIIGSNSRAGYIGTIGALILFILLNAKQLGAYKKQLAFTAGIVILTLVAMQILSGGLVGQRFAAITDKGTETVFTIDDIQMKDNLLTIKTGDITLVSKVEGNNVNFYDGSDTPLSVLQKQDQAGVFGFLDERYADYQITVYGAENILGYTVKGQTFFMKSLEGKFKYMDNKGKLYDSIEAEHFGFEGKELMGSSRGYIWSRSLPMIKHTLIWGHGADNYSIYFPQHELLAKAKFLDNIHTTVDKPHNWYIQMAINTGFISMLAIVILLFVYGIDSLKLYLLSKKAHAMRWVGTACIAAVFGYALAGFFNDSIVSVAPIFWAILGMGIGINRHHQKAIAE